MTNSERFSCPCLNVSFEYVNGSVNDSSLSAFLQNQQQQPLDSSANRSSNDAFNLLTNHQYDDATSPATSSILTNYFLNSKKFYVAKSVKSSHNESLVLFQIADVKVKYPSLIGQIKILTDQNKQTNETDSTVSIYLSKCLICNTFTNLALVFEHSDKHIINVLNDIELISKQKEEELMNSSEERNNYSFVYEIFLFDKSKSQQNDANKEDLKMLKNIDSTNLLKEIQEKYDKHTISGNSNNEANDHEKLLKQKFENLVKSHQTPTESFSVSSAVPSSSTSTHLVNKIALSNMKPKQSKRSNDDFDTNDVFDFEEMIQDGSKNDTVLFDDDDEDEANDDEEDENANDIETDNKILKKRNSNIETFDNNIYNIHQQSTFNKPTKYSCSLPREIPAMSLAAMMMIGNRSKSTSTKKSSSGALRRDDEVENRNVGAKTKRTNLKAKTSSSNRGVTAGVDDDILFEKDELEQQNNYDLNQNNDVYQNDDDQDDDNENDDDDDNSNEDDDDSGKDMARAISDLASSIVAKDGRELFGGVPSRRTNIPINSISQSYF